MIAISAIYQSGQRPQSDSLRPRGISETRVGEDTRLGSSDCANKPWDGWVLHSTDAPFAPGELELSKVPTSRSATASARTSQLPDHVHPWIPFGVRGQRCSNRHRCIPSSQPTATWCSVSMPSMSSACATLSIFPPISGIWAFASPSKQ